MDFTDFQVKNEFFQHLVQMTATKRNMDPNNNSSTKVSATTPMTTSLLVKDMDVQARSSLGGEAIEKIGSWRASSTTTTTTDDDDEKDADDGVIHPVMRTRPYFVERRVTIIDVPAPARFDYKYLNAQRGTLCYVVALDTFDEVDTTTGMNKLEQEMKNLLEMMRRAELGNAQFFTVIFTKINLFEAKIRAGIKLPSPWQVPSNAATAPEVVRFMIETLSKQVTLQAQDNNVYIISATSVESAQPKFFTLVQTLCLTGELVLAGFLS